MDREIKFRCFNEGTGKMIDLYRITPLALDANLNSDGLFIPFKEGYKLMQFTRLQDKNGKDIYEGDIIKSDTSGTLWVVEFGYCFDFTGWFGRCVSNGEKAPINGDFQSDRNSSIQVIGNQHESPELIDNK